MATYSNILAWEIPWTEESDGLQSMGSQKSRTQLSEHVSASSSLDRALNVSEYSSFTEDS